MSYNLTDCALIVEFNASVWTARRLDRSVTDELTQAKGAGSRDAARVNKSLMAGRSELEEITKHVTAARTYVYDNTFPWSDSGQRLLPTERFIKFEQRMDRFRVEFHDKVAAFVALYPSLITAQAMALGAMFKRDEYPRPEELARKFDFRYDYLPVPASGDFRVDIPNDAQRELQTKLSRMADARMQRVVDDVREKLREHLERMSDRLVTDYDPKTKEPKQRRFHDTLVTGAYELCALVKDLPVLRDDAIDVACRQLEQSLNGLSAQDLRDDHLLRDDLKRKVDALRDKFAF